MRALYSIVFLIIFMFTIFPESATARDWKRGQTCPGTEKTDIELVFGKGHIYETQASSRYDIARQKKKLYGWDDGVSAQGSIGQPEIKPKFYIRMADTPGRRCVYPREIHIEFKIDHEFSIASEYVPGDCVYEELYVYEMKLLQKDEKFISDAVNELEADLIAELDQNNSYGPYRGSDMRGFTSKKREELHQNLLQRIETIRDEAIKARMRNDDPGKYNQILAYCGA